MAQGLKVSKSASLELLFVPSRESLEKESNSAALPRGGQSGKSLGSAGGNEMSLQPNPPQSPTPRHLHVLEKIPRPSRAARS